MKKLTYEQKQVVKTFALYFTRGALKGLGSSAVGYMTTFCCLCYGMNSRVAGAIGGAAGGLMYLAADYVDNKIEELNHEADRDYYVELMKMTNNNK